MSELVKKSDAVVVGTTQSAAVGHHLSEEKSGVLTRDVLIDVDRVLKGPVPGTIVVDQIGYSGDDIEVHLDEMPWSQPGDSSVWFLTGPDPIHGHYAVASLPGQVAVAHSERLEVFTDDPVSQKMATMTLRQLIVSIDGCCKQESSP